MTTPLEQEKKKGSGLILILSVIGIIIGIYGLVDSIMKKSWVIFLTIAFMAYFIFEFYYNLYYLIKEKQK